MFAGILLWLLGHDTHALKSYHIVMEEFVGDQTVMGRADWKFCTLVPNEGDVPLCPGSPKKWI